MVIHSNDIKNSLIIKYNKKIDEITEEETSKVRVINFSGNPTKGNFKLDLRDFNLFPNLEIINFSDAYISSDDIKLISSNKNIKEIKFFRCAFQNEKDLTTLQHLLSLEFNRSYIESYGFIEELQNIELFSIIDSKDTNTIDCTYLKGLEKLRSLSLRNCTINNFSEIGNCKNIGYISLLGTKLPSDFQETLNQLPKLKDIYINKEYITEQLKNKYSVESDFAKMLFDEPEEDSNTIKTI